MTSTNLAHRGTGLAEEAVPTSDPSDTTSLLLERLQAYKHACGYLEAYFEAHEKAEKAQAKEYEKILKTVSNPLREGDQFDQQLGGIAGFFEAIRSNTQGIANAHLEQEKNVKGSVLPILARLHTEIKNKTSELNKGAAKGSKEVDKARQGTQKHIEMLGQHSASFTSAGGRVDAANDPYLLQRGIKHRLHKQVLEENSNRQDLISVQDSFATFEAHIIETFQQASTTFLQYQGGALEREKSMYADIVATVQRIPKDFEFKRFIQRKNDVLVDPSAPQRSAAQIPFANQDHPATQPLIAGSLQRKSRLALKGYDTGYYVITPSKYLHQFADDDDTRKDPSPEISLYLPDCTIGGVNGEKFSVKGKDASKGKVGSAMATSSEFQFKAHTAADAEKWYAIIKEASAGGIPGSVTASPIESRNTSSSFPEKQPAPIQTSQQATGYQASPITPGAGVQPGSAGPARIDPTHVSGVAPVAGAQPGSAGPAQINTAQVPGVVPGGSVPSSGVEKAPGQY